MADSRPEGARTNHDDYPPEVYKYIFDVEPKHFWFKGRNMIIRSFIRDSIRRIDKKTIIEVGCGTGFVLSSLEKMGFTATGVDMHKASITFAAKRTKAKLLQSKLEDVSTKEKFDVLGAFDVLEHIEDEKKFLKKCSSLIKKNGTIILTVPARKELWSKMDEFSGHKRRYDKTALIKLLKRSGLKVKKVSYFGFFLLLPQWAARKYQDTKIDNVKGKNALNIFKKSISPPSIFINKLFELLFLIESGLIRYVSLPTGSSIIVAARKP